MYLPQCMKRIHNAKFWRNHFQSLLIVVLLATQRLLLFDILPLLHFFIFVYLIYLCLLTDGALKVYCYIFIVQNWVIKWFLCLYNNRVTTINPFMGWMPEKKMRNSWIGWTYHHFIKKDPNKILSEMYIYINSTFKISGLAHQTWK